VTLPTAGRRALVLVLVALAAAAPVATAEPSRKRLARAIDAVVARRDLSAAFWGVAVRSLSSGRTLYERNATHAFRPASTMKLVTTAAALDAYGPEARLRTTVETAGRLDGLGRILGDLYLVGRGDPDLSSRYTPGRPAAAFEEMADALAAAGVKRIEGRLVGHDGAFATEPLGRDWTWEDLAWGYGAPVSALVFEDDQVTLRLTPGEREGDPAVFEASPTSSLDLVSTVTTVARGTEADLRLERAPGSDSIRLSGRLPIGGDWSGSVAIGDPARHAVSAFAAVLAARDIRATGGLATSHAPLPPGMRTLVAHESPPMAEIVRVVNKESQNLHAEMLLRLVGLKVKGDGSVAKGHEAVVDFLDRLGVPHDGFYLADGCGLARTDLLTPRGLAALLVAMDRHPAAAVFRDSLPVAGRDGTLETRLLGTPAEGKVVAKTGTLNLVSALAGYATTRAGDRLAFAVFVNNQAGRAREATQAVDAVAEALAAAR
jgi:D-alanyl-D-alanine carboxypeptidase/D-alanyl-D-alanine-endopeptidase (penicillin-binding protein 4)